MPFAAAIGRIASDLGLLARAAAESEGNIALGGFLKAIEVLRQHSCDFDSASDLIGYLERLEELDETEGCTALPPDSNVVRVMNLHKAKGLEAPVVFLADTAKRFTGDPICHIDRSSDEAVGYMGITAQKGQWATKEVATPARWKQFQAEEQRFLEAEADRLLYVATTRAACMLVVSVGKDNSNWSGLHPYLDDAPELCVPTEAEVAKLAPKRTMTRIATLDPRQITDRWAGVLRPSYIIESAKEVALKGSPRPTWHASGDYGYKWGSAVHELLEIVAKTPAADLAASALMLAGQYDLGTEQVDELVTTIRSVTQSEIWKRSQAATQCFSELPFEAIDRNEDGTPIITRGVIDLLFEEFDGWVIVDYKSDDLSSSDIESAVNHYRHQLIGYAAHWQKLTAAVVKEAGLYFTKLDRYVTV
jgi:ATP-dependent helicase/nuclease subunit A